MDHYEWLAIEAQRTLQRLTPGIEARLPRDRALFFERLHAHWDDIFRLMHGLYGTYYDFYYHLEQITHTMVQMFLARPDDLRALDVQRAADKTWFQSEKMLGGVLYVDLFAGDLTGVRSKLPYFKELGLTYLHLMPLFKAPQPDSDGGYAISDYRAVNPPLGTMAQLADLAREFRANGISLVLDFVFNHTSNEHLWAQKALSGDAEYQDFYYMFPDRNLPDEYERTLREVFPEQAPGNFTWQAGIGRWVWTTFRHFQWDLNYSNPAVFNAMLGELMYLANQGMEVIRLDAVAFIWKQIGTSCESLPQAHQIIRAYNAILKVVAPALLFKSEAIVHPDMVASYIDQAESPLSYHPTLMALLWEALATRDTTLLSYSMQHRFHLPEGCSWVNYVRCHDDIGWTFADEDARAVGVDGYWHRQFLNQFYIGKFPGSFARGVPFNYNPINQDMRISGMGASLAGLEQALTEGNALLTDQALRRLLLIHSIILSVSGIPLIYLGDELALLNDYSYTTIPGKQDDSRWAHRVAFDWQAADQRHDASTPAGWLYTHLRHLIGLRQARAGFGGNDTEFFFTGNKHILGYVVAGQTLVLANFSDVTQPLDSAAIAHLTAHTSVRDLVSDQFISTQVQLILEPLGFVWLDLI